MPQRMQPDNDLHANLQYGRLDSHLPMQNRLKI